MARELERLTAKGVQAKRSAGYYADGGGLYLQVSSAGTKSWIFRFHLPGMVTKSGKYKVKEMGLGPLKTISLLQARERALECRRQVLDGINPVAARDATRRSVMRAEAKSQTFSECAAAYIKKHRSEWKNAKHAEQWENTIETYCAKKIGGLPVQEIDTGLVLQVLAPIWLEKKETASRLRARIEAVLNYATALKYREGDNPARWRGHLEFSLAKRNKARTVKHHAAMPFDQLNQFIVALREQEGTAAQALEFAILTAARTGEVIGARMEEFDLEKGLWTIPAARMKSEREHRVPLTDRAIQLVRQQPDADCVFSGRKGSPLSNMAMLMLLRRMGHDELTVHGFRSTFRDWCSERTSYPREVCEMALAHAVGDATEAAYRRGDLFDRRALLMAEWGNFCEPVKAGEPVKSGEVVPLGEEASK